MSSLALNIFGTLFQANSEKQALKASARADEENARRTELSGELTGEQVRRDARAADGEAIVASAANGVSIGTGSAADVLTQSAVEREYAVLTARYNAGSEANVLRQQGRAKRKAAKAAMVGGILRAGAQAMAAVESARRKPAATGGTPLPTPKGPSAPRGGSGLLPTPKGP